MAEQTQAVSSPAEVTDPFNGEHLSLSEYQRYRDEGEVPERFKAASAATTGAPEETAETPEGEEPETDSESVPEEEAQEPPQKDMPPSQKRILQLLAEKKELQRQLEAAKKPDVKTDPSPAAAPPNIPTTRPKPTVEDVDDKGNPKYATYEDYVDALTDWKMEQKFEQEKRERAQQEQQRALDARFADARKRYEDADEVIIPAAKAIYEAQIPLAVKQAFSESELLPDLCYVVGSDPDEFKRFVNLAKSNPRAAFAKIFEYERAIREELAGNATEESRSEKAPEVKKTAAPKPPSPVNGAGSSRAFDVSDESLSPEEWARKRNQDISRKRKS